MSRNAMDACISEVNEREDQMRTARREWLENASEREEWNRLFNWQCQAGGTCHDKQHGCGFCPGRAPEQKQ